MFNLFKKKEKEKVLEIVWTGPPEEANVVLKPARLQRDWMDSTQERYAYRCLPLNIANQHGWAVYPKREIVLRAHRDDRVKTSDIEVITGDPNLVASHFGHGTFTFMLPFIPRLPEGYSLWIGGMPNQFINGAMPLTGIYEADWGPFSTTMNWKVTRKNYNIRFTTEDAICFIFPIYRPEIEEFKIKYSEMSTHPDQEWVKDHKEWGKLRNSFNKGLAENSEKGWQRHYFQGKYPDGRKCPYEGHLKHRTKLDLDDPNKK